MNRQATCESVPPADGNGLERLEFLKHAIEHSAHLLPAQAPIRVFVHHNTLHAFEDLSFDEALRQGSLVYGCHGYLPEERYRQKLARGRILPRDLSAELIDELGDDADQLIGFLGTRFHLRLAMLQYPLRHGSDEELHWLIAETDALSRFRAEVSPAVREQMLEETRRWVLRDLQQNDPRTSILTSEIFSQFRESQIETWNRRTWESFALKLLWQVCYSGVKDFAASKNATTNPIRLRDLLLKASRIDIDVLVNQELIRFCGAFLDQGIAHWALPHRELGFYCSWFNLYGRTVSAEKWLRSLPVELKRINQLGWGPLEVIDESLTILGIPDAQREEYLLQTLLALRGWAGIIWQMETNAEWLAFPAPTGTLIQYVAVRLILERLAIEHVRTSVCRDQTDLLSFVDRLRRESRQTSSVSAIQRAFLVFQLAQVLGWKPEVLKRQSTAEWQTLTEEIENFSEHDRRRVYHLAFERRFRINTLDALVANSFASPAAAVNDAPSFQLICCIDEREESFRRHVEELAPRCETFGTAGFFGVAMYYKGATDAHFVPLCPVVVKPRHYVEEEVVYSFAKSHQRRTETRRVLGKAFHAMHRLSRSGVGGVATAMMGTVASIPLVAEVLFPRLTSRIRHTFATFVQPPLITRQSIERTEASPGSDFGHLGYSIDEMIAIAGRVLRDIGLVKKFGRLVIIMGHGSSSLNNPHNSAYNCGACGGGRGGPNARALAAMLGDPRVRDGLLLTGVAIPKTTVFVGACHNTCDDSIEYYDLDRLPSSHRHDFESAQRALALACRRNAHERCRRFESAELFMSPENALRHVQARAEDLSQVRPECGHATNACCFVGRRTRTKGLFLDRRTFLTSYDPTADNSRFEILERTLQAVIPVCAGINLEYYFSYVDSAGYGCGSKLPHNISCLLGVMDGAASDLRPGLPWQMVEIHEPVRILFIVEAPPNALRQILDRNPALNRLIANEWVQLAIIAPNSSQIAIFHRGEFKSYSPENTELPAVDSSLDWYRGWRDHLEYAFVGSSASTDSSTSLECVQ